MPGLLKVVQESCLHKSTIFFFLEKEQKTICNKLFTLQNVSPPSLGCVILYIITVIKGGVYKNLKNQTNLSVRCSIYHHPADGFISKVPGCAAVKASPSPLLPKPTSGLNHCIRSNQLPTSKSRFLIDVITFKRAVGCKSGFVVMILSSTQLIQCLPFSFVHHWFSQ